ncbi:MAG: class I SAM-dependent methyltransferase [Chloroflexi bacterium]|nr:class I SAM-dependent methyltransferase [Chloroflexota bacterium]
MNINTKDYWDKRFQTGNWEQSQGRKSTRSFAIAALDYINITPNFKGTILDFGCGLGDAIPIYHSHFLKATLMGMDISVSAINQCCQNFGEIARFMQGDFQNVPNIDVIISSNVFEHLTNPIEVAIELMKKCKDLYIITPYKENITTSREHINSFDENSFTDVGEVNYTVFSAKTWTQEGLNLFFNIYLKNTIRPLIGKIIIPRSMQIIFHIKKTSKENC